MNAMLSKNVCLHRNRPVVNALERAADSLLMDYLGGLLFTASEYGLRGLIADQRVELRRSHNTRVYLRKVAGWIADDLRDIPALLFARLIGPRGMVYLMRGALNGKTLTDEAIIPAHQAIEKTEERLDPALKAQHEQWAAEREAMAAAQANAEFEAWLNEPSEPTSEGTMISLWGKMTDAEQLQAIPHLIAEARSISGSAADSYAVRFWHALDDNEAVIEFVLSALDNAPMITLSARRLFADWRTQGSFMTWMANHYEPLVMARINSSADTLAEAA